MKPSDNSTSTTEDTSVHRLNSPVPYLFGGLAVMLGLIAVALLILVCSYKISRDQESSSSSLSSNNDTRRQDQKLVTEPEIALLPEMEPKFVVIMPGDNNPTCLAKPTFSIFRATEQV